MGGADRNRGTQPRAQTPAGGNPQKPNAGAQKPGHSRPVQRRAAPKGDEVYLGQTLNNRFKIESKIG
ncbi:MAG: hypothetical protein ACM31C_19305, partial [Acidobacteriota bacterium]